MNFDPGLEQLRGDQATFESAQELSHIFSYNLRPKKLFLVWVDFPALCLKVAKWDGTQRCGTLKESLWRADET